MAVRQEALPKLTHIRCSRCGESGHTARRCVLFPPAAAPLERAPANGEYHGSATVQHIAPGIGGDQLPRAPRPSPRTAPVKPDTSTPPPRISVLAGPPAPGQTWEADGRQLVLTHAGEQFVCGRNPSGRIEWIPRADFGASWRRVA